MRLRDPKAGTVVHVGEDQAARYLARGFVDTEKPETPAKPVTESPRRGRPAKPEK